MTRKIVSLLLVLCLLAGCGGKNMFVGTYGGTDSSGRKVEITINKNNTVTYTDIWGTYEGTWEKHGDNSIELDFDGQVSSSSEPLIVSLSADGNTITVDSLNSGWNPDYYQRR